MADPTMKIITNGVTVATPYDQELADEFSANMHVDGVHVPYKAILPVFVTNVPSSMKVDGVTVPYSISKALPVFQLPVKDAFTRADANELGSNWSRGYNNVIGIFGINGNRMDVYTQVYGYTHAYWNKATFGPNVESRITVTYWGTTASVHLCLKTVNPDGTTPNAYEVVFTKATNTCTLKRVDSGVRNALVSDIPALVSFQNGDRYGAVYYNGVLYGYHKPVSGGWYCIGSVADAVYLSSVGYSLLYVFTGTDILLDDFGTDTIS